MINNPLTAEDMRNYISQNKIVLTEESLEERFIKSRDNHDYVLALGKDEAISDALLSRLHSRGFSIAFTDRYLITWGEKIND